MTSHTDILVSRQIRLSKLVLQKNIYIYMCSFGNELRVLFFLSLFFKSLINSNTNQQKGKYIFQNIIIKFHVKFHRINMIKKKKKSLAFSKS